MSIVFLLLGVLFIYLGSTFLIFVKKVKNWPTVKGKLIEKHLGEPKMVGGEAFTNKRVFVEYEYVANGQTHHGRNLYSLELMKGERTDLKKKARKILEELRDPLTVYHNPSKPEVSFLIPDNPVLGWFVLAAGLICTLTGTGMLVTILN